MTTLLWTLVTMWTLSILANVWGVAAGRFPGFLPISYGDVIFRIVIRLVVIIWALVLLLQ